MHKSPTSGGRWRRSANHHSQLRNRHCKSDERVARGRRLVSSGATAKRTKELINRERIYPPRSGGRQALLDAAAPTVQTPPVKFG